MTIVFYIYFSWWVYGWFLAYKAGLTDANPWFMYVLLVSYIVIRYTIHGYALFVRGKNYMPNVPMKTQLVVGCVSIFVDVIPIFFLTKRTVMKKDVVFALLLGIAYISAMLIFDKPVFSQYTYAHFNRVLTGATPQQALQNIFIHWV